MKLAGRLFILGVLASQVTSFSPPRTLSCRLQSTTTTTSLAAHNGNSSSKKNGIGTFVTGLALAGTIFASSMLVATPEPSYAAGYEISSGAIVVNTSTKAGQSLLKAEVDVKDLLGSVLKNRKALKQSIERISNVVKEELKGPAWAEIVREVLQTERDVAPDVQINPPSDYQQLIKDLASGRLNLIVNGELINLSIDETSTAETDELVIRAKGIKGSVKMVQPAQMIAKTRLQEQIEGVDSFWNGEFTLTQLPESVGKVSNGLVFGGGTLSIIVAAYVVSYAYYIQQQDQAAKEAEEKRQKVAANKAAAAAKAKAAKEEGEE